MIKKGFSIFFLFFILSGFSLFVHANQTEAKTQPQLSGGGSFTVGLKNDGSVWTWGVNNYGQLGDGTTTNRLIPVQVQGLTGITQVLQEGSNTVVLKSDGTVWSWGYNYRGFLGDGTTTSKATPVQVKGLTGITQIAKAGGNTFALKNDGTIWAWGFNDYAQINGTYTEYDTPVQETRITGVTQISGSSHVLALKNDGTVWAWGYNSDGQVGDGTTGNKYTPVQVQGLTGITQVSAGPYSSFALKSDGTVWSWGQNWYGQLGNGTTSGRSIPAQIQGLTGVTQIVGGVSPLALTNDGTVWAWGYNTDGEVGDGTTTNRLTPVQVQGLTGVTQLTGGGYSNLALKSDGTAWAWGYNSYGQLGDGTTTNRLTPVQMIFNVDGFPPTLTVSGVTDQTTYHNVQPTVSYTVSDDDSGVLSQSATYTFIDPFGNILTGSIDSAGTQLPFTDGMYILNFNVTDKAGNSTARTIYINTVTDSAVTDTTPPTIHVSQASTPNGTWANNNQLTFGATDDDSGVKQIRYQMNGGAFSNYFTADQTITLPEGTDNITIEATDKVGNIASKSYQYNIATALTSSGYFDETFVLTNGIQWLKADNLSHTIAIEGDDKYANLSTEDLHLIGTGTNQAQGKDIRARQDFSSDYSYVDDWGTEFENDSLDYYQQDPLIQFTGAKTLWTSPQDGYAHRKTDYFFTNTCALCTFDLYSLWADNQGYTSPNTKVATVGIDGTPPTVEFRGSASSSVWLTKFPFNITVGLHDQGSGLSTLQTVKVTKDGVNAINGTITTPLGQLDGYAALRYQGLVTSSGTYQLQVFDTDAVGNTGSSSVLTYKVDMDKPNVTFSPNGTGSAWSTNNSVTVTPTDTGGSGVGYWKYRISTNDGSSYGGWINGEGSSQTISLPTGKDRIQITVTDGAGNTNTVTSQSYWIDTISPSIHIKGVVDGVTYPSAVTPSFPLSSTVDNNSIYDTGSGYDNTSLTATLTSTISGNTTTNSFTSGTTISADGDYTLTISINDLAGNNATKTIHFTINSAFSVSDTTAPTIQLSKTPNDTSSWYQDGNLTINATDSESGAKQIRYQINNGTWSSYYPPTDTIVTLPDGTDTLNVEATDNKGNVGTQTYTFYIDSTISYVNDYIAVSGVGYWNDTTNGILWEGNPSIGSSSYTVALQAQDSYSQLASEYLRLVAQGHDIQVSHDFTNVVSGVASNFNYYQQDPLINFTSIQSSNPTGTNVSTTYKFNSPCTLCVFDGYGVWRDKAGNTHSTKDFTLGIDGVAPTVSIDSGDMGGNGWYKQIPVLPYRFSDQGSGLSSKSYSKLYKDGSLVVTMTINNTVGSLDATLNLNLQPWVTTSGNYQVVTTDTDNVGLGGSSTTNIYKIDLDKPNGTFSLNGNGGLWEQGQSITMTPTDTGGSGVASWQYRISTDDGATYGNWVTGKETSQSISLPTGKVRIQMSVTDGAGNTNTVTSQSFGLDTTAPVVTLSGINEGTTYYNPTNLSATYATSDTGTGVDNATVTANLTRTYEGATTTVPYTSGTPITQDGVYTLTVIAKDMVGNQGVGIVDFTVINDTTPPTVTLSQPETPYNSWTNNNQLTIGATDDKSGVKQIRWRQCDGSTNNCGTWSSYFTGSQTITMPDGKETFNIEATDNAGNVFSYYYRYYVDTTPPTTDASVNASKGTHTVGNTWWMKASDTGQVITLIGNDSSSELSTEELHLVDTGAELGMRASHDFTRLTDNTFFDDFSWEWYGSYDADNLNYYEQDPRITVTNAHTTFSIPSGDMDETTKPTPNFQSVTTNYSFTTNCAVCTYDIYSVWKDKAGNMSGNTPLAYKLGIDGVAPVISFPSGDKSGAYKQLPSVPFTVTDQGSGIDSNSPNAMYTIYKNGDVFRSGSTTLTNAGGGQFSGTLDLQSLVTYNNNNPLQDGLYTVTLSVDDVVSNTGSVTIGAYTIDTTPPSITNQYSGSSYTNPSTVITLKASDGVSGGGLNSDEASATYPYVDVYKNGTFLKRDKTWTPTGMFYTTLFDDGAFNETNEYVYRPDSAWVAQKEAQFTYEYRVGSHDDDIYGAHLDYFFSNTPLDLGYTQDVGIFDKNGKSFDVVSNTGVQTGVTLFNYDIYEINRIEQGTVKTDSDYSLSLSSFANGDQIQLKAHYFDKAGNEGTYNSPVYTMDTVAPSLSISGVTNGGTVYNTVTPTVTATDSDSGIQSTIATLNGSAYTIGNAITTAGTNTLTVTAKDKAGNTTTQTVNFTLVIDTTAPTITVSQPPTLNNSWTNNNQLTIGATDDKSGVKQIRYKLNNGTWSSYFTANQTITLPDGYNVGVLVEATDNVGNVVTQGYSYNVDTAKPTTNIGLSGTNVNGIYWEGTINNPSYTIQINGEDKNSPQGNSGLMSEELRMIGTGNDQAQAKDIRVRQDYQYNNYYYDEWGYRIFENTTFDYFQQDPIVTFTGASSNWTDDAYYIEGTDRQIAKNTAYYYSTTCTLCTFDLYEVWKDNAGNTSSNTKVATLGIDGTRPSITFPSGDFSSPSWRKTFPASIPVQVTDQGSGVNPSTATYTLLKDGATFKTGTIALTTSDGGNTYNGNLALQSFVTQSGTYQLQLSVQDNVGNTGNVTTGAYKVDVDKPNATFSPDGTGNVWLGNQTITLTPTDTGGSDIATWQYRISNDDGATYGSWVTGTGNSQIVSLTTEGKSRIQIQVTDGAGNTNTVASQSYWIDKTPPTINITGVEDGGSYTGATPKFPLSATVDNNAIYDTGGSGLDNASLIVQLSRTFGGNTTTNTSYQSGTTITQAGHYTLFVKIKDKAGNESSKSVSFDVIPPPTLTVTPVDNIDTSFSGTFVTPLQPTIQTSSSATDPIPTAVLTLYYDVKENTPTGVVDHGAVAVSSVSPVNGEWDTSSWNTIDLGSSFVSSLHDGTNSIELWIQDDQGASSAHVTLPLIVDSASPVNIKLYDLPIDTSSVAINSTIKFRVSAEDPTPNDASYQSSDSVNIGFEIRKNGSLISPTPATQVKLNGQPSDEISLYLGAENGYRTGDTITITPILDDGRGNIVSNAPTYTVNIEY